jgi:hypothetical protein
MPGQWPGDWRTINDESPLVENPSNAPLEQNQTVYSWPSRTQGNLEVPRSLELGQESPLNPQSSPNLSPSLQDELFLDWPLQNEPEVQRIDDETASSYYLAFEPVVQTDFDVESVDWRRYNVPAELLRSQEGISNELNRILAPSIERIQARHQEEEERRAATSRIERPLARAGRASVKPRRQVETSRPKLGFRD